MSLDAKPRPFVCPECRDTENYFGRVVFADEDPLLIICPNHDPKKPVALVPVSILTPPDFRSTETDYRRIR